MQSSGTFPALYSRQAVPTMRAIPQPRIPSPPAVRVPLTPTAKENAAIHATTQDPLAKPKKRRQLTATAPTLSNTFANLQPVLRRALNQGPPGTSTTL